MRISGSNTLLPLIALEPIPAVAVAGFVSPIGITSYVTVAVYGHPPDAPAAEAPGLVGWFHLAGGLPFVVLGIPAFVLLIELLWRTVWYVPLLSRDVALALFGAYLLAVTRRGDRGGRTSIARARRDGGRAGLIARYGLRELPRGAPDR